MNKNKKQKKEMTNSITKETKRKFVERECYAIRKKVWIIKCKKIHKNKYDYSKVNYKNNKIEVKIVCKKHGIFKQKPTVHSNSKSGCPKCGIIKVSKSLRHTKESFIKKSNKIHRDEFDYSLIDYVNNSTKIKIICKEHGVFKQTPNIHLRGGGCKKCKSKKLSSIYRSNIKEFIKKSKNKHGNKYDYSKVNYINSNIKVKIICPLHGQFFQTPHGHVNYGCSKCAIEKLKNRFISKKTKRKLRMSAITRISNQKFNGGQLQPSFNIKACQFIEEYGKKNGYNFQHAMNGGEYSIIGYFLDGYDKEKNVVFEYDEPRHFDSNGNLKEKDLIRMNEIKKHLGCRVIRYSEKLNKIIKY